MTKAVIDIGDKEMAVGCTFVAVSGQPLPFEPHRTL